MQNTTTKPPQLQSSQLSQSVLSNFNQHLKKMNINVSPLSLCPSPSNKCNTQKSQKQIENKPQSAKNMTQPKKLALFQSVSNLKIKDSITKKRKSEQNLLKGAKNDKKSQFQPQNQPLLTQTFAAPTSQQNVFYMTEGNEQKETNLDYYQAQGNEKGGAQNPVNQNNFYVLYNALGQQQINYMQLQQIQLNQQNFIQCNQQINSLNTLKTQENELLSQQIQNKLIAPNQNTGNSFKVAKQEGTLQDQKFFASSQNPQNDEITSSNSNNNQNNYNNSGLLQKTKQGEITQPGITGAVAKTNKKINNVQEIQTNTYNNSPTLNNHTNSQQTITNKENSQSPQKIQQQQSKEKEGSNRRELQLSLNEPDLCNIFKKVQPDYTSMMEMLSHRNKQVQKLSNYKLNLSEKLLELRSQVHLLQSTQKRSSLQDVAQQGIISKANTNTAQLLSQKIGNNNIQDEQQLLMKQQYNDMNQNEELNTVSNLLNSTDPEQTTLGQNNIIHNDLNNVYVLGANGYAHNNQVMSLNMMQSLTNDEIVCPLSTKSQGIPVRDNYMAAQNAKVHHLSNDFGMNKENLLFSSRTNNQGNIVNGNKNDRNITNSNKKKKVSANPITASISQPQKIPKQAQVFKFNNIQFGDTSQSTHQIISNHEMESNGDQNQPQNSADYNYLQEQQNEILRQITAPLSSKSVRNDQHNIMISPSQKHFSSVGNQVLNNQNGTMNIINQQKKLYVPQIQTNLITQQHQFQNQHMQQSLQIEEDQYLQNSAGKKTKASVKKSSKDFLLDKLQSENQISQSKLQNRNYANVNTLIASSASIQPNNMPPKLLFPATTTAKSQYQASKISNSSPIFYKSTNQLSRMNQNKKKNAQLGGGGSSARLNDQENHRMNKHHHQIVKCSTTENSKVCRRLSTNDGNAQNYSQENIILNSNNKNVGNNNLSQGNGFLSQEQNQQYQQQGNSTTMSNGNSTYFPLTKKEIPQLSNSQQGNAKTNLKNPNGASKNGVSHPHSYQQKLLLSNAQSYTTSNNSTNGNTQHYSSNYQNQSSQVDSNGQPFLKNIQFNQQNTNYSTQENPLSKSTPLNQLSYQQPILLTAQQELQVSPNAPFNTLKSNAEEFQSQLINYNQQPSLNIEQGLQQLKQKMMRVLNKYSNKQGILENINRELLTKLENLKI